MNTNQLKNSNSLAATIQSVLKMYPRPKLKLRPFAGLFLVANPCKFVSSLLSKGILCDGTNETDKLCELKDLMVQLAINMACLSGADAIAGLIETLEESGNSHLIAGIIGAESGSSEAKGGGSVVQAPPTVLPKGFKLEVIEEESGTGGRTAEKPDIPASVSSENEVELIHLIKVAAFKCCPRV